MASHPSHLPPGPSGAIEAEGDVLRSTVELEGNRFERLVVRTHWIEPGEPLGDVMARFLRPLSRPGDCALVSEKATVIAYGLGVPADDVVPGWLARRLAGWVRPTQDSRGLSIPEKMQLVMSTVGVSRMLLAVAASAITRPFKLRGAFYLVAGPVARGMDGMRPPLEHLLLPPLDRRAARRIAAELEQALGMPVAIVDINDRGGCVRCVSGPPAPSRRRLMRILRDNPLGQRGQRTPIGLVRHV